MVRTRSQTRIALTLLPPDVIAHILTMPGITVEDLAQVDRTCRLFAFAHGAPGKPCGHSIVESALRLRRFAQTGESVPATLPRPTWWTWPHLKAKLFYDERCRRGVRLVSQIPSRSGPDIRKNVIFFHSKVKQPSPPEIVLGRMTRAFDNGQGIQDPRVSRQHLRVSLLHMKEDFAPSQPSGVARVLGLGHNPSTIRRATTRPGESSCFKLRRGDTATLYPGDVIQLVCEDVSRAHERSLPFEGNPCAYKIEMIPENCDLSPPQVVYGREVEAEGTEAGSPEQAATQS